MQLGSSSDLIEEINQKSLSGNFTDQTNISKSISAIAKVIDVKDLEYAIDFHFSNSVAWHQERQVTLNHEYDRVLYQKGKHFVLSKIDYNRELYSCGGNLSRMHKGTQIRQVTEQEKQVYHAFEEVDYHARDEPEYGESEDHWNYHLMEKQFIRD